VTQPSNLPSQMMRCLIIASSVAAVLSGRTAVFEETFAANPETRGWRRFGDSTLFHWNLTNQNLEVTWDSSRTNSFFYVPLETILTKTDDFNFSFDLRLSDIRVGSTAGKPYEFEIAIGLLNYSSATNVNAFRGAGADPTYGMRNLVEFDYFPDAGFGDTFATTVISTNNRIFPVHNFPLTMIPGDTFRLALNYAASNQLLRTVVTKNGVPFGLPPNDSLADLSMSGKADFRVDSFAVISYSDARQGGSVLAHGTVDNIQVVVPRSPIDNLRLQFTDSKWRVQFLSQSNWVYALERSTNWSSWVPSSSAGIGTGESLDLADTNLLATNVFYRIRAERR
jgi:hypothetical protein